MLQYSMFQVSVLKTSNNDVHVICHAPNRVLKHNFFIFFSCPGEETVCSQGRSAAAGLRETVGWIDSWSHSSDSNLPHGGTVCNKAILLTVSVCSYAALLCRSCWLLA